MRRKDIFVIPACMGLVVSIFISCATKQAPVVTARKEPQSLCHQCHDELAGILPEGHVVISQQGIQSCLKCHGSGGKDAPFGWISHFRHYSREDFGGDCWSCHAIDEKGHLRVINVETDGKDLAMNRDAMETISPYVTSWASSEYLDRKHALNKITCGACHEGYALEDDYPMDRCLHCHGPYQDVALLTKDVEPNPHDSHLGELNCNFCHKAHEASENFCGQCHAFEYNLP